MNFLSFFLSLLPFSFLMFFFFWVIEDSEVNGSFSGLGPGFESRGGGEIFFFFLLIHYIFRLNSNLHYLIFD